MIESNVTLKNSRESFDNELMLYYEDLKEATICEHPTPQEMTRYQKIVDDVRTDAVFDYGLVQAELSVYSQILKAKKEMLYSQVKDQIIEDDPKAKPTDSMIKSGVSLFLNKDIYENGSTLPAIVNELMYREAALKGIVDILFGKQSSVHTPNNQIKIEYDTSSR